MSPSAYLRGGGSAILHTLNYLAHLERVGTRVINGVTRFYLRGLQGVAVDSYRLKLGVSAPRSRVIHRVVPTRLPPAEGLRFPGRGQGQRRRQRRGHRALRYFG